MYLLLHWMGVRYVVLNTSTARLGQLTYSTVLEAVINFNDNTSFSITERPNRFTLTDTALIDDRTSDDPNRSLIHHKIIARLDSLDVDYLQQRHPELLI